MLEAIRVIAGRFQRFAGFRFGFQHQAVAEIGEQIALETAQRPGRRVFVGKTRQGIAR